MIDYGYGIKLGPLSDIDPDSLLKWRNNPLIYKWCRQFEPLDLWSHEKWLSSLPTRTDVKMYSIKDPIKFMNIGVCGLTSIDMLNRHAEFSIYIGPEFHGNGFGELALRTLCAHGFKALGLHHIFGETFHGNPAAKMFEKVGFKKEGTRRGFYFRNGRYIDAYLYSKINDEVSEADERIGPYGPY